MVREIVSLQIGQCGNQTATQFWDRYRTEHELDEEGFATEAQGLVEKERIDCLFRECTSGRYCPRNVLIDLEPGPIDVIKSSRLSKLFKPDNYINSNAGAGNNWAKGHYGEGNALSEHVLDVVRKEVEDCDCNQGFFFTHSIGGGTGSGMGTLMIQKVFDQYPSSMRITFTVYPSKSVSDTVVEPYNAVLAINQLLENTDFTHIYDNESLYDTSTRVLKEARPNFGFLNSLIATHAIATCASQRFPGELNADQKKIATNLLPFPRLHFFIPAIAPLVAPKDSSYVKITTKELVEQIWMDKRWFTQHEITSQQHIDEKMKVLTCFTVYRGDIAMEEIDKQTLRIQCGVKQEMFVEWIPQRTKCTQTQKAAAGSGGGRSAINIINSTIMKETFNKLAEAFSQLYMRKAFLQHYKGEGMDEMEFQEADRNLIDVITEYQGKHDASLAGDEDEDADDEE